MERDNSRRIPLECAVIAIASGWAFVLAVIVVLFLCYFIRELIFRGKDERDQRGPHARPFYTPELRRLVGE